MRVSALHPQANGFVERLNRSIGELLRKTTDQCGDNWDLEIPFVQFHYMNHDYSATGYSLFYLSLWLSPSHTPVGSCTSCRKPSANSPEVGINPGFTSFKIEHSGAVTGDLQEKQRRVAGCPQEPSPLHDVCSPLTWIPY